MADKNRVIVAGGGPVGIFTAISLTQQGIPVTVLEEEGHVNRHRRAGGFHPPTVDMMEESGLAARMKEIGYKFQNFHFVDRLTGMDVILNTDVLKNDTQNPWDLLAFQEVLTNCGYELLTEEKRDVEFRFNHRITDVVQKDDSVLVTCEAPEGTMELEAPWVLGCDGASSQVRKSQGIEFEGYTWPDRFLMAHTMHDFTQHGYQLVNFIGDAEKWQMIMKIPFGRGRQDYVWRMVCRAPDDMSDEEATADSYTQYRMQELYRRDAPYEIFDARVYRVHQKVAETFRRGRVVLLGDAAHINNPIGGQGLNCGIHDVNNFSGKFGQVWRGEADDSLLDLYDRQRRQTNWEFIQPVSVENKERMDDNNLENRKARSAFMESLVDDPEARRQFFLRFAMFDSLEYANSIT